MGSKYREYNTNRKTSIRDLHRVHPIWRGVGFAMMVLIPVIGYAASDVLIKQNDIHQWTPLPVDLFAKPGEFLYNYFPDPLLYIRIMIFVAVVAVLFALFTLVSFMMNGMFGITDRNDPYYVPPVRRQPRRPR